MKLLVNGETTESRAETLAALLAALDYGEAKVATAVNGDFVPAGERAGRRLADGDAVEILAPMQGG